MAECEKVHLLTEAIYKNILDNFNPGVRQLITSGRALQKALHNVTTAAKSYIEVVYSLARSAQVCKGATSEIGAALLQIAEVQKEINNQVSDNIKSFHAELLIPAENKQEGEFKQVNLMYKKYCAGHKYHMGAYEKAQSGLKKHKKKTKSKYGYDQKEMQLSRDVRDCQGKLEDYHMQNLRFALLEERKRYCFTLDRICSMVRNYASHHSKAHELLTHRLPEWSEMTKNPHILPESSEAVIQAFRAQIQSLKSEVPPEPHPQVTMVTMQSGQAPGSPHRSINKDEVYNNPDDMADTLERQMGDSASMTYGTSHRLHGPNMDSLSMTYARAGNGLVNMVEDPYATRKQLIEDPYATRQQVMGPPGSQVPHSQARALYLHSAATDTQLSFVIGDVIALIGEKRNGWQYGENQRTHQLGWFPSSFTEPMLDNNMDPADNFKLTTQRVKSLGNLADIGPNMDYRMGAPQGPHSDSDSVVHPGIPRDHRAHSISARPISMHGDPAAMHANTPKKKFPAVIEELKKSTESFSSGGGSGTEEGTTDPASLPTTRPAKLSIPDQIPRSPAGLRIPSLHDPPPGAAGGGQPYTGLVYPKPEIVRLRCTPAHVHLKTRSLSAYESSRGLTAGGYMTPQYTPLQRPVPPLPPSAYYDNDSRSQYKLENLSPRIPPPEPFRDWRRDRSSPYLT